MININKEYHLTEIVDQQLIPGVQSYHSARNIVFNELLLPKSKRILHATIYGSGNRRTIKISGKNLAEYIKSIKKS